MVVLLSRQPIANAASGDPSHPGHESLFKAYTVSDPRQNSCTADDLSGTFQSGIRFAEMTDVGMRRLNNQDSLVCVPARSDDVMSRRGHLFVVADGMGAHAAGELASQMATDQITDHYRRLADQCSVANAINDAITLANTDIHTRGQNNPDFHNMGTTASALVLWPGGAVIGHVGDSRVYRLRDGVLEQWTFDHSLVWELEAGGGYSPEAAAKIPRNVITRSLGPNENVQVDIEGPTDIRVGDKFLLCSDGLTGPVTDEEIAALMDCLSEQTAAQVLVDLANLRGGPDNISTIVVGVTAEIAASKPSKRLPRRSLTAAGVAMSVIAIMAVCAATLLLVLSMIGPAIVAVVVAGVSGGLAYYLTGEVVGDVPPPLSSNGGGPYRRYKAVANQSMLQSLRQTVDQLRDAADKNNWLMDWTKVDASQNAANEAVRSGNLKRALSHQAESITETMKQLREQHNQAASETTAN